jgi:dihydroxy-acid dehydratase
MASWLSTRRPSIPPAIRARARARGRRLRRPAPRLEWLYVNQVLQADRDADLDFLVGSSGDQMSRESH